MLLIRPAIKRSREVVVQVEEIRDTLVNLRSWVGVLQQQQEEVAKANWRLARMGETATLWEWHDIAVSIGDLGPLPPRSPKDTTGSSLSDTASKTAPTSKWLAPMLIAASVADGLSKASRSLMAALRRHL